MPFPRAIFETLLPGSNPSLTREGRAWLKELLEAAYASRFRPPIQPPVLPRPTFLDGDPDPQPPNFPALLMGEMFLNHLELARTVGSEWPLAKAIQEEGLEKEVLEGTIQELQAGLEGAEAALQAL